MWVDLQLRQQAIPVLWVVIDSVVSCAVYICQDPLAILRNESFIPYCLKDVDSKLHKPVIQPP